MKGERKFCLTLPRSLFCVEKEIKTYSFLIYPKVLPTPSPTLDLATKAVALLAAFSSHDITKPACFINYCRVVASLFVTQGVYHVSCVQRDSEKLQWRAIKRGLSSQGPRAHDLQGEAEAAESGEKMTMALV